MASTTAQRAAKRNGKGKPRTRGGKQPDETRIEAVYRMRASFERPEYIRRVIMRDFGVTRGTVNEDIKRVEAEIFKADERPAAEERREFRAVCMQQFRACVREGDQKTALGYLVQIARIGGFYAAEMLKTFNVDLGELQLLGDDDFEAALREEVRKQFPNATPNPEGQAT